MDRPAQSTERVRHWRNLSSATYLDRLQLPSNRCQHLHAATLTQKEGCQRQPSCKSDFVDRYLPASGHRFP
ncbi:hypothetical protein XAB3213_1190003 [Xanthomonas citri pv. bilvae]|nr:hypothetical protein XAB3213_1190003 [Xanthomonas citri pv. bilvae]